MKTYVSTSGKKSGVIAYEVGNDFIIVKFNTGKIYKYTNSSAGKHHIDNMIALALNSCGLSTYITKHKPGYSSHT
ncbi:hypothetical protein QM480_01765 [Flectobacillus sp. DC10W]|uniref:KTSC domain-containing protein n=1 Tax=Flectobacillus longus TaxID=2984207 RepID=A0ABT6YIP9_9BACT|nr:hypothetical protein [Flectobacillus longus]MDI9863036.1 hypothetical protein [Flectobacillus longus]